MYTRKYVKQICFIMIMAILFYPSIMFSNKPVSATSVTPIISTIVGEGTQGITVDSSGNVYYVKISDNTIYKLSTAGTVSVFASLGATVSQLVIDANDNIYATASNGLKKIDPQGTVTPINGPSNVSLNMAIAIDNSGNVYYSEATLNSLNKVDSLGNVTTLATGFNSIMGIAVDSNGNVYVADYGAHVIKKINTSDNNNVTVIAGTSFSRGYSGNGNQASDAMLNGPHNMIISDGQLYFAEYYNCVVRKIDLATGIINVVAGSGTCGNTGDGEAADAAQLGNVYSISKDISGNIYIAASNSTKMVYLPALAPVAPNVTANDTNNTIIGIDETMEYKIDEGEWTSYNEQTPPDLSGNKTVKVRVKATNDTPASEETQLLFTANPPGAPNITANDTNNTIIGIDETMEYKIDDGPWTPYNEQTPPDLSGNKTVKVRVKATNETPASEETQLLFTANPPGAPNVTANDTNNTIIGIDETMEYKIDDGPWTPYNEQTAPDLSGNKTVKVRVKATNETPAGKETQIVFTANPVPINDSPSTSDSTPSTSQPTTEQIVVDVDGNNGLNLTKTSITRSTEQDGTIKDTVSMTDSIAKETVLKAKEQGIDTARIIIPDKEDKVAEVKVEIPKAAVEELNKGNLKLEVATSNVVISIPTTSIDNFNQDLYFRIVPIKSESGMKQVEERAKNETLIQEAVGNNTVQVLGRPMEIETNMQSRQVSIVLPITSNLPTDPAERQKVINNLGVYIEHSDGTKELIKGTVVIMNDGSEGLEFEVNKFSTFTIVYLEGWQDEIAEEGSYIPEVVTHTPYIKGYSNNEFRPNELVTRAQMATMLAQNLEVPLSKEIYLDVKSSHWAFDHVMEVKTAGIMTGVDNKTFNLNGNVTRAQMASIVYRWIQNQCEKDTSAYANCAILNDIPEANFKDVTSKYWAAEAINFTKAAGIMEGFDGNTFKPNQELTRAQAVKVLNILFKRGPLTDVETPKFKDVPKTHWAFGDVEEAAREHDIKLDANR